MYLTIKRFLCTCIERSGEFPLRYVIFNTFIILLIICNIITILFESVESIHFKYAHFFRLFEICSVIIFTAEYIMRLFVSDLVIKKGFIGSRIHHILSPMALIDLAAILPFYLPMLIPVDLRFLRILRLLRLFRIFKLTRYVAAVEVIGTIIKRKRADLLVTMIAALFIMLISSTIMYYAEHSAQPESFPDIFAALWWAVATLTTVGYGDIYPVTATGKIISGIIAFIGIGLVALPTGIISSAFVDELQNRNNTDKTGETAVKCPHCGHIITKSRRKQRITG